MPPRPAVCPVQVGRDEDVHALVRSLEALGRPDGPGRLVLIGGEAGVGKSRLAAEAMAMARSAGLTRLEGACTPEASVPYACFVHALRRRTRTMAPAELTQLFDGPACLAALLLPEVAEMVGTPSATPAPEDLYAAVWQVLSRLARPDGGAVLLLEDVHWADPDSLRLLAYLAGELGDLPLWLVTTYRTDELHRTHPLTPLVGELVRRSDVDAVDLVPLDREQVRTMVSELFDRTEVGDDFADVVLERTGGNPFFVEELARVLVESGDVYHSGSDWERRELADIHLPASVRETLLARTRSMSATALTVLHTAAIAGDRLEPALLARASGATADEVDDTIRSGLELQLLVEDRDGGRPEYRFRHALTREAFADELVGPDRRRTHRRIAEAILELHEQDDGLAATAADHFAAAGDDEAALEQALRAARYAGRAGSASESDHRYDQALRLLPSGADADARRLELLVEAAGTGDETELSRLRMAFAHEARALAAARSDPSAQAAAINALEHERWISGDAAGTLALLQEARSLVHGRDDYREAWVVRRMSRILMLSDRIEESQALIPEGIELAERSGNLAALAGLHGTLMMLELYGPGFHRARESALAAARAAHDPRAENNIVINTGYVALWCGDFALAERSFQDGIQLGERIAPTDRYVHAGLAWLRSLQGRYAEALALAGPLRHSSAKTTQLVALTALAETAQRQASADTADVVDEFWQQAQGSSENQRSVPAMAAHARQMVAADGIEEALPLYWTVIASTVNSLMRGSHWPFSPDCALALAQAGRVDDLVAWVERVRTITGSDPNEHNLAAHQLCEAYLAAVLGDRPVAAELFRAAVARYAAMPCPARQVEAMVGLAGVTDDVDEQSAVAAGALRVARETGAGALVPAATRAVEEASGRSVLATVLFTDIVGSTSMAARLGDQGWSDLLERHNGIVRRELARAGGREIDTAGDGFLAAFTTPAQAIRCAVAIRDALAAAGIPVRAGLHTGEARESGDKLTGLTVHIASRVVQAAGPGEVLVSGTVRDMVVGSALRFADRGVHELKGVPGEWHLYALATT
jgi:eukaryotic-like serine/threonine-protein kinase